MRAIPVLLVIVMMILAVSCKKDNIDPNDPNDPNDTTGTNTSYTQVKGDWNWIGQDFIHIPSNYGIMYQTWQLDGGIYCYWREDIGAQFISRVSFYDGSTWTNLFQDVNADAQMDFAVYNDDLYHFASDVNGSYTLKYTNGVATYIDTANWATYSYSAYLASTGNDLIRMVTDYGRVQGSLTFERWSGTDWVVTDSAITIAGLPFGYPKVIDGTGKVYIMINESSTDRWEIYSYAGTGTLAAVATVTYGIAGGNFAPKIFDYNGNLHIVSSANGATDYQLRTIVEVSSGGAINTVLTVTEPNRFLIEVFPTAQGILYTQGTLYANTLTTLTDIFLMNTGKPKRYNVTIDEASRFAITNQGLGMGMLREGGIYNGGSYFFYTGGLYCLNNAHLGSQLGRAATKVVLAKYNEL